MKSIFLIFWFYFTCIFSLFLALLISLTWIALIWSKSISKLFLTLCSRTVRSWLKKEIMKQTCPHGCRCWHKAYGDFYFCKMGEIQQLHVCQLIREGSAKIIASFFSVAAILLVLPPLPVERVPNATDHTVCKSCPICSIT